MENRIKDLKEKKQEIFAKILELKKEKNKAEQSIQLRVYSP